MITECHVRRRNPLTRFFKGVITFFLYLKAPSKNWRLDIKLYRSMKNNYMTVEGHLQTTICNDLKGDILFSFNSIDVLTLILILRHHCWYKVDIMLAMLPLQDKLDAYEEMLKVLYKYNNIPSWFILGSMIDLNILWWCIWFSRQIQRQ